MKTRQWLVLALLGLGVLLFFWFDLDRLLSLEQLKRSQQALERWREQQPLTLALAYFGLYVAYTSLSIPGSVVLTLAAGAIFGFWTGLALAALACTLGACIAFLAARYVLREALEARFAVRLAMINRRVRQDGAMYLFIVRLIPVTPFFIINLLMGLTRMRLSHFYLATQLGTAVPTAIFVNAGTQLARIESPADILGPRLLASLALLAVLPLLARAWVRRGGVRGAAPAERD